VQRPLTLSDRGLALSTKLLAAASLGSGLVFVSRSLRLVETRACRRSTCSG
jgi:hypothetical protein